MESWRSQMAVMREELALASAARSRVVGDIKAEAGQLLRAFSRERMTMARTLQTALDADRSSRFSEVQSLRDDAIKFCTRSRRGHLLMGQGLRRSLVESRTAVVNAVNAIRTDSGRKHAAMARARRLQAKVQRADLSSNRSARALATAALMRQFHAFPVPGPVSTLSKAALKSRKK